MTAFLRLYGAIGRKSRLVCNTCVSVHWQLFMSCHAWQCTMHAAKLSSMHAGLCHYRLELHICTGYAEPMPAHRQRSWPRHRARYGLFKDALQHQQQHRGSLTHVL